MRSRRGKLSKSKKPQADVFSIRAESVPAVTNRVATDGTMFGGMSDEVYYHHWTQMINVWPYL